MKAQASSNIKAQAPIKGGGPPTSSSLVRQIVAGTMCHIDRHIVAWPAVQGHRHKLVDNLNYFLRCLNSAVLLWDIVGCQINNNGGEYGITIRLHCLGHRRMDQGAARHSCKFLLDHDGYRHGNSYEGKPGRGYFPDHVSSNVGSWTMDRETFSDGGQRYGSWNERLQMQRGLRSKVQVYSKVDQGRRKLAGRKTGEERGHFQTSQKSFIVPTSNPGEKSPGFFYAWIMDNRKKEQATSNMRQGTS